MEIKDLLLAVVSIGSLVVAVLAFRRNRRIDSENLLFKYKSEGYVVLLEKLTAIMDKILEEQKYLDNSSELDPKELKKELNDRAEKFDLIVGGFANDVLKHSLFFSKEINVELDSLSSFLFQSVNNGTFQSLTDIRNEMETHYNNFLLNADYLLELMRKDLHIDQLNMSLSKRLKGIRS